MCEVYLTEGERLRTVVHETADVNFTDATKLCQEKPSVIARLARKYVYKYALALLVSGTITMVQALELVLIHQFIHLIVVSFPIDNFLVP